MYRLRTQKFALSCIAAKTWGLSALRTLVVYTAVIRSAMTYAASMFTTEIDGKMRRSEAIRRRAK